MNTYHHVILLLSVAGLTCSVLEVVPLLNLMTQGTANSPATFTLLSCIVRPPQYTVTWLHAETALSSMGKYSIQNGSIYNETTYGSLLTIDLLSYTDAGNYTCVIKPSPANGSESYSATIQLILLVKLEVLEPNITVNATTTSQVELSCEMSQYIHPDGDLWWYRGGQRLDSTQSKYSIGYRNGTKLAQNGGSNVTTSRVSVLTISQLTSSDNGVYTCRLFGTDQSEDVNLTVVGSYIVTTPTTTAPITPIAPVIGAIAGFLLLVVIVLVLVILMVVYKNKCRGHLEPLDENEAYERANSVSSQHRILPLYSQVSKPLSPSPAPGNLQDSSVNSHVSLMEPPGYEDPDKVSRKSHALMPYSPRPFIHEQREQAPDPYHDVRNTRIIPPTSSRKYYEEVEPHEEVEPPAMLVPITSIPTPVLVLSGSLPRDMKAPDFSYAQYQDGFSTGEFITTDPDYDQIYSEALDPAMLTHDYDMARDNDVAIPYSAIYDDPKEHGSYNSSVVMVTRRNIVDIRNLGMGQFGQVILARTVGVHLMGLQQTESDSDPNGGTLVAIKKLKLDAEHGLVEAFDKEVKFMSRLKHDNVVRLLGVCTEGESFIMMEYMENGDLNQFLQKQKVMPDTISGLKENEVTPIILLYMGVQIASGMHYLSSRRFVHRDLATRNCLVGRDFVVKISDFGMSRSLYESAYYRVQGTLILPIRWMACETFYGKFSVKSDSWAFGVSMWEIYTLGKVDPYEEMTDEEVIADAIRGPDRKLLPRPDLCSDDVYDIMQRCWVGEPTMRADFGEIYSRLFMIYTKQGV